MPDGSIWVPLVSILVPAYNQAGFIADAVDSALAQDYPLLEVVVSDDASTDDTGAVAKRYESDSRFRYSRNPTNRGYLGNFRRLIFDLAKGDWVITLDGDDVLRDRSYIRHAIELVTSEPDIVLVFAKVAKGTVDEPDPVIVNEGFGPTRVIDGTQFCLQHPPLETVAPMHMTCLYRRELALHDDFHRWSDFASYYQLMLGNKIGFLDRVAGLYRRHARNMSSYQTFKAVCTNYEGMRQIRRTAVSGGHFTAAQGVRWMRERTARVLLSACKQTLLGRHPLSTPFRLLPYLLAREPGFVAVLPATTVRSIRRIVAESRQRSRLAQRAADAGPVK
jgi:glycosyltransferase involved in cell wall biosynthesis